MYHEFQIGEGGLYIVGDDANSTMAWSLESLNTGPLIDRMVAFDVTGLDIYYWNPDGAPGDEWELLTHAPATNAWILAFDPGRDSDFQDMLIYMDGGHPWEIPAPGAVILGAIGLGVIWRTKRYWV